MALLTLQYRELLPYGVEQEFDALIATLNRVFAENHTDQGDHGDVTMESLTATTANVLPVTGSLRFLKGRILLDALGNSSHVAGLRPAQWTADVHNYNPPGSQHAFMIECDTDADRSITGLERHARQKQIVVFGNRGNFNITLEHNHASSSSWNRFGLPGGSDLVLASQEYAWLYYDVGSEIWRYLGAI